MAWYDEWPALVPILETMQMAECQRCKSFQADFEAQEREHKEDEVGWGMMLSMSRETAEEYKAKARELERQLVESQRQNQQQQQQLDAMRENLQAQHNERLRMDRGITFDLTNIQH